MAEDIVINVVPSITCPAGHTELQPGTEHLPFFDHRNPEAPHKLFQIRAFKVDMDDGRGWCSECLVCKRWFAEDGEWC
jgi:hypothetical protein